MVINKTHAALRSSLTLAGASYGSRAKVWRYDDTDLHHIRRLTDARVSGGVSRLTYPGQSMTLLVLPRR